MTVALHPRERDPRQFPFGLYLVESAPIAGVNGFHWFRAESEAAEFLRNGLWPELPGWDEFFPGTRTLFQEALRGRCDVSREWLDPVESEQDHLLVLWYGAFDGLLSGSDPVARSVLESYAESPEARDAATRDAAPFIGFLRKEFR